MYYKTIIGALSWLITKIKIRQYFSQFHYPLHVDPTTVLVTIAAVCYILV